MRSNRELRRDILASLAAALVLGGLVSVAAAQHRAEPRRPPERGVYVFVGGYFYDMRFGSFPWWTRRAYPFPYFPTYRHVADVRVNVTPKSAGVFVDGFYAGVADDFNGYFKRLSLTSEGHEIVLYLEGYRTEVRRIYLAPGSTFKLNVTMVPTRFGQKSDLPKVAPPVPPPPPGSVLPPRTPSRWLTLPPAEGDPIVVGATVSIRVRPADAALWVDGGRWMSSEGEYYAVTLAAGTHFIDVSKDGYRPVSLPIVVREGEPLSFNIVLVRERR